MLFPYKSHRCEIFVRGQQFHISVIVQYVIVSFIERLNLLCKEKGISISKMIKDLGMANGNVTRWNNGLSPRVIILQKSSTTSVCPPIICSEKQKSGKPRKDSPPKEYYPNFSFRTVSSGIQENTDRDKSLSVFFYFKYSAAEYPMYSFPPYSAMTQSHVYPFASVTASATIETFLSFGM